jgi:LPS export ABC transporter protein LptC
MPEPCAFLRRPRLPLMAAATWLALTLLTGCGEKLKPAVTPITQDELPGQESWRSTVTFSDSARIRAILWAGHIAVYGNQRYTLLSDSIHIDFFDDGQRQTSTLTARRGKINDVTRDFEAYENVIVVSDNGNTLKTERLFWTNATRKIHTDVFVDIAGPKERIRGHGMESDQDLRHYTIFRVTGQSVGSK